MGATTGGSTGAGGRTDGGPADGAAEVMIECHDIAAALAFYVERFGFRVDAIFPAESPSVAVLRGYGIRLRLDPSARSVGLMIRLAVPDPSAFGGPAHIAAPDGTIIDIVDANPPLELPPVAQSFVLERASDAAKWTVGRAGMRYRDLIPDRQGGRFVASHIHVPNAGLVPDYVHFHKVRFQMIYCYRGWTRLVYEDQGDPFIMSAGDCVLQPPQIRHRVLESSADLHVIEVGCPALHETLADPDLRLPNGVGDSARLFGGQRFAFHSGAESPWVAAADGFDRRRFGFAEATFGLAEAAIVRPSPGVVSWPMSSHEAEFLFYVVVAGSVALRRASADAPRNDAPRNDASRNDASRNDAPLNEVVLYDGDSVVLPAGQPYGWAGASSDLRLLEVTLPARPS